jgi:hypothetical protein
VSGRAFHCGKGLAAFLIDDGAAERRRFLLSSTCSTSKVVGLAVYGALALARPTSALAGGAVAGSLVVRLGVGSTDEIRASVWS